VSQLAPLVLADVMLSYWLVCGTMPGPKERLAKKEAVSPDAALQVFCYCCCWSNLNNQRKHTLIACVSPRTPQAHLPGGQNKLRHMHMNSSIEHACDTCGCTYSPTHVHVCACACATPSTETLASTANRVVLKTLICQSCSAEMGGKSTLAKKALLHHTPAWS
jgi:hypothetical protein